MVLLVVIGACTLTCSSWLPLVTSQLPQQKAVHISDNEIVRATCSVIVGISYLLTPACVGTSAGRAGVGNQICNRADGSTTGDGGSAVWGWLHWSHWPRELAVNDHWYCALVMRGLVGNGPVSPWVADTTCSEG